MTIIAIDGPTGVGKSTTAKAVAAAFGVELLLDPVSVSPLLDTYYTGDATPAAAVDTELAFLRSRAELLATADADSLVVSDFSVMRTAPFSEFLDDPNDREQVLDEMRLSVLGQPQLDVLVLLHAAPGSLLTRVRTRDRASETELTIGHLDALTTHFNAWRSEILAQSTASIVIDTEQWDPRNSEDLESLVERIRALVD